MTLSPGMLKALGMFLPLAFALLWTLNAWQQELQRAERAGAEQVARVAQFAERLVQTQLVLHAAAVARASDEPPGFLRGDAFHHFLAAAEQAMPLSNGVMVMDLGGQPVASSRSRPTSGRSFKRTYVQDIAEGAPMAIARLNIQPADVDALVVASPFRVPGFSGLIASSIPAQVMRDFLRDMALPRGGSASLLHEDGVLLIRHDDSPPMVLPPGAAARAAIAQGPAGSYRTVAVSDGVERIYSFVRVGDLPLFAHFGTSVAGLRIGFVQQLLPFWALMASIVVFSLLLARQLERQITARMQARELGQLAEQRAGLLAEMNHRVKNNLAMILALIASHKRDGRTIDPDEMTARVLAISEVHDLMYRSDQASPVDFGEVIERLCASPAILPPERGIVAVCQVERGILLDPRGATSLVLAVAELMTNAVKHGFAGRDAGTIRITLRTCTVGVLLEVRDDGQGLPDAADRHSGLKLVRAFVMQVGGQLETFNDGGAVFRIRFPPAMMPAGDAPDRVPFTPPAAASVPRTG